jgi:gluconolactonase
MYVEAEFERFDERFARVGGDARLERLHDGCRWAEGPVYFPAARSLVWSDIPNDRMLRWDETTGAVGVFRHPAGYSNGNSRDRQGRLLTCEQGPRRVTRTEHDGSITVLADRFDGKRFNSPNDLVEAADGAVWFTDPRYGISSDYEGSGPRARSAATTSTASTRRARSRWRPTTSSGPTAWRSPATARSSTSSTPNAATCAAST